VVTLPTAARIQISDVNLEKEINGDGNRLDQGKHKGKKTMSIH
jgi:hypothetical protein